MARSSARAVLLIPAVVLLATGGSDAADGYGVAGPFQLIPERFDPCPPEATDVPLQLSMQMRRDRQRTSRWFLSGNVTTSFVLDDGVDNLVSTVLQALLLVDSWGSRGGWKSNAFRMLFSRFCSAIKRNLPKAWRRFMTNVFGDPHHDCPFPPGNYAVRNFSLDVDGDIAAFPVGFYGKYRAHIFMLRGNTKVFCINLIISLVPKYAANG